MAALHLVVLMLLLTASWKRPETDSSALTLVNIEASKQAPPEILPKLDLPEPKMVMPRLNAASTANDSSTNESAVTTAPATIPNWRGSLEGAATAALERAIREQGYRALGPVAREQAGASSPPSIFETPRHKAGDIESDTTQGRTVIWHSENCYTELNFPTIKDPNALVGAPNPPKCVRPFGGREPRGDLFEHMDKPN